MQEIKYLEMHV